MNADDLINLLESPFQLLISRRFYDAANSVDLVRKELRNMAASPHPDLARADAAERMLAGVMVKVNTYSPSQNPGACLLRDVPGLRQWHVETGKRLEKIVQLTAERDRLDAERELVARGVGGEHGERTTMNDTMKVSADEVVERMRQVVRGEVTPYLLTGNPTWDTAYCGNVTFVFGDMQVTFFNDCDELDYVDNVRTADGRTGVFDDWADGEWPIHALADEEAVSLELLVGEVTTTSDFPPLTPASASVS